jgi:hypothetical protein
MVPHEESVDKQAASCDECEHNQFGSAEKGRGKKCKNSRRVAVMSAGTYEGGQSVQNPGKFKAHTDTELFEKGERFYVNVPPTSINGYGAFVKQLAGALKVPPFGVFTKMSLVPDPKTQVKLTFEPITRIPTSLNAVVLARHRAEREQIMFPFPKPEEASAPKGKGAKGKPKGGKAAPRGGAGRF